MSIASDDSTIAAEKPALSNQSVIKFGVDLILQTLCVCFKPLMITKSPIQHGIMKTWFSQSKKTAMKDVYFLNKENF